MSKKIIIGNVREEFTGSPSSIFQMAVRLSKEKDFTVSSNNPQFIEALEVLCGEENVSVFFKSYNASFKLVELTFQEAYDYLGEVYDIIYRIRWDSSGEPDYDRISEGIMEYNKKWEWLE